MSRLYQLSVARIPDSSIRATMLFADVNLTFMTVVHSQHAHLKPLPFASDGLTPPCPPPPVDHRFRLVPAAGPERLAAGPLPALAPVLRHGHIRDRVRRNHHGTHGEGLLRPVSDAAGQMGGC